MIRRIQSGIVLLLIVVIAPGISQAENDPTRQVFNRTDDQDGVLKILLYYDMEGISGQNIITSIDFPRPEYFEARELLTADCNAAIDGLFAGGADSVYVVDAHGSFNPEPDILLDKMDPRARMLYRKERFDPYADLIENNTFDAVAAVAMHSRTGGGGFAEHTINLGTDWIMNGKSITESDILAFSWGRIGIPLIFVSGDDKLADQLKWMDWIEYVTVKKAKGIADAELFPVDQMHQELREAAKRSVENLDQMRACSLSTPITAALRVVPPADLTILSRVPGLDYEDQKVTFAADNFAEAYEGMRGLLGVAQSGYYDIAANLLLSQGDSAFQQFKEAVFEAWQAAADTTTKPPEKPPEAAQAEKPERLYFGSQ
jgi:D-amino peptidase